MAKILVADDNSNIQKMVGLALKDQGIDVVAVGNGEAAVRKISDIHPDLVLADVFMPVRNGYEVCQYVKQDPALAHIPVILLVGAFDPLDEQEAQRVGADGVLKKPFVPPDPLIAMVKAALTRAGVSYSSEKTIVVDKPGKSADRKAAEVVTPRPMSVPPPVVMAPPVAPPESISMEEMDGLVEEVSLQPAPVKIEGGAPLAFGNLMESGSAVEEDPGFIPAVHPELAVERDWRATEEEDDVPEEEEEEKPKAAWRRDADTDEAAEGVGGAVRDWRDTAFNEPPTRKSARENWGAAETVPAMTEAAATKESTAAIFQEAAAVTDIHPGSAPSETIPQVTAFPADAWASAISAGEPETVGSGEPAHETSHEAAKNGLHTLTSEASGDFPAAASLAVEHDAVATAIDRFAGSRDAQGEAEDAAPAPGSAWELQAKKSSLLAATWDAPVTEPVIAEAAASAPAFSEAGVVEEASAEAVAEEPVSTPEAAGAEALGEVSAPVAVETQEIVHEQHAAESGVAAEDISALSSEAVASGSEAPVDRIQVEESLADTQEVEAPRLEENEVHEETVAPATDHEDGLSHVAAIAESACTAEPPNAEAVSENQPEPLATPETTATADKTVNEDVVARVLASLSPEVMQAVTRELLKPVVEAMVREELNKKK